MPLETRNAAPLRPTAPPRARWLSVLDRASVSACAMAWLFALRHVAPAFSESDAATSSVALGLGFVGGYVLADFISGTVHWMADRYFDPTTPLLGPALIAPFREHHEDALAMTRHDFFEISGNNGLVTIPLALLLCAFPPASTFGFQLLTAILVSLSLAVLATNQFHCWAHVRRPPTWVRRLQRAGIILSPARHALHHDKSHDRAYCVTSGWLNPWLDRIGFFSGLESLIARVHQRASHPR